MGITEPFCALLNSTLNIFFYLLEAKTDLYEKFALSESKLLKSQRL
jgi:hypothetical protein